MKFLPVPSQDCLLPADAPKPQQPRQHHRLSPEELRFASVILACKTLSIVAKYAAFCLSIWWLAPSLQAFAGRQTRVDIKANTHLDVQLANGGSSADSPGAAASSATPWILAILTAAGIAYARLQRRLYRQSVRQLQRTAALEKQLDPNRQGSGLIQGFQPNPEDR